MASHFVTYVVRIYKGEDMEEESIKSDSDLPSGNAIAGIVYALMLVCPLWILACAGLFFILRGG